jgi:hypothetical protein
MNFRNKLAKLVFISIAFILISYFTLPSITSFAKDKIPENVYLRLSWVKNILLRQDFGFYKYEIKLGDQFTYIQDFINNENFEFSLKEKKINNKLSVFKLLPIFPAISVDEVNTAYIDFHNEDLLYTTKNGIILRVKISDEKLSLSPVKSNLSEYLLKKFEEKNASINYYNPYSVSKFGIKDIHIDDNYIYASYIEDFGSNLYNTSVIKAEIKDSLIFKKLFSPKNYISSKMKEFSPIQSGGRIRNFKNDSLLLTIGEYRDRSAAQSLESVNGKIISINKKNGGYRIVSLGHRNPQGLDYYKEEDYYVSTEHGPFGGDEINFNINTAGQKNYGWPISSYGIHYEMENAKDDSHDPDMKRVIKEAPLFKSHNDYGFIEPIKYFKVNPAISEVRFIKNNFQETEFIVSTLGYDTIQRPLAQHLIHFKYNFVDNNLSLLKKYNVAERVRDLAFDKKSNNLYFVGESTGVIGKLNLD